ncbi:VOC family protein [Glaesserella sp.]|uniref:VOC family protein n=1 Tax=Glaesserella sp. TaxID=2094731 RepID=UPI0035A1771D
MIQSIGQIMLYMSNPKQALQFWCEKIGFQLIESFNAIGAESYVIAPTKESDVQFVIHDKNIIAKFQPELNLLPPSILLRSSNLQETYTNLKNKGVFVNEIQDMGNFFVCNFKDEEGNYFAIKQDK